MHLTSQTLTKPANRVARPENRGIAGSRALHTLSTLLFASSVCVAMLVVRFLWAGNLHLYGLFENLLLAWIPLSVALLIRYMPILAGWRRLWFWGALFIWILFFPNAFYLVTDLSHMSQYPTDGVAPWFDMLMTTCFAAGGIFLGCLSLYLMHLFVRQRFGSLMGWTFAVGMLAFGSFGIYMGRVLRLNSWDIVAHPFTLIGEISSLSQSTSLGEAIAFCIGFFFFSLAVYTFVISIARLHEDNATRETSLKRG